MGYTYSEIIAIEIGHLSGTTLSGGDRLMLDLMPYLKKLPLQIIIPDLVQDYWQKYSHQTLTIPSKPYLFRLIYALRLLDKKRPKIIISNTNYFTDILPAFFYKIFHPDVIWLVRILHISPLSLSRLPSFLIQQLCLFITNHFANLSLALNSDILENLPTQYKKLLPAGIDLQFIRKIKPTSKTQAFDLIFIGRFHKTKGIDDLPKIMDLLPKATLGVIGEGTVSWHHPRITLLGRVNDTQKFRLLKKSKLFICTDHEAGWGIAVAEAMACGLPVVAFNLPIFGRVFSRGFKTVPMSNISALSHQISKILNSPDQRKRMSILALAQAKRYPLSASAQQLTIILNEITT